MSTSEFDKYKVDHLFLLIGENPLPNYVAARLLLNPGGTPYLVYTTGTEKPAKRLQTILSSEPIGLKTAQLVPLNDGEADAYQIQKAIRSKLETIKDGKIGLNYTGGTKAMAVHAYRAVFSKERPQTVFSYLDPRRLEMCIDRENGDRIRIKVKPEVIPVELAKVFQIHGWTWQEKSDPIDKPELPEAAKAFAEFHKNGDLVQLWRDWCNEVLRKAARDEKDKNKWKKETKLTEISTLSLEKLKSKENIMSTLSHLGVVGEDLSLHAIKEKGIKSLESACKWLDGEWLEHYVLQQVQEIPEELFIYDSATSFWIRNPIDPKNTKFQFDVAFMRGYQLFAISCTTIARKSDCKSKLFEAYIRARQLGGDEARVALVCCASEKDVNALETEIVNVFNPAPESGQRNHKIAVFGRDDLMDLASRIAEWIKQNDKDAR
ncbi:Card1-like endonuclease domain-containing protein [Microcoleus sp. N3A4]|uniref:Card1-like endonuclease domain-containing protein n=1 Tax=Microcoleus sp. N3A4 TaxID=3055379 RepID=UPI00403FA054